MNEYNNKNIHPIDILVNNLLMDSVDKEENKLKKENSTKRENLIGQIFMDYYGLEINNDPAIFQNERITKFVEVSFSEKGIQDKNLIEPIETKLLLKNSSNFNESFSLLNNNYEIQISNTFVNIKNNNIYCQSIKEESTKESDTSSKSSKSSKKNKESNSLRVPKFFQDNTGSKNLFIMIRERQHEIDGSFITKNEIDDLKELKKILLYPTNKNATIKSRNRIIMQIEEEELIIGFI